VKYAGNSNLRRSKLPSQSKEEQSLLKRWPSQRGQVIGLIDPHGDLAETIRMGMDCKIIYWDIADRKKASILPLH